MKSRKIALTVVVPIFVMALASGCGHDQPTLSEADLQSIDEFLGKQHADHPNATGCV